jgi:hypothetical protein
LFYAANPDSPRLAEVRSANAPQNPADSGFLKKYAATQHGRRVKYLKVAKLYPLQLQDAKSLRVAAK